MGLPDPAAASSWGGRTIVDRAGAAIGPCTQVFTDDATGRPEWARARIGDLSVVVPLLDAVEDDGRVRVSVTRDEAVLAPAVADPLHLREDDEESLYRHYGIPFSRDASRTVLPAAVGGGRDRVTSAGSSPTVASVVGRVTSIGPLRIASWSAVVVVLAVVVTTVRRRRGRAADDTASRR